MSFLPYLWYGLLLGSLVYFIIADGATLGLGFLSLFQSKERRERMLSSINPIWYSDETWLVVFGAILFGAFPLAYSLVLSALYVPALMLIFGLAFRTAGSEFRSNAKRKNLWSLIIGSGALVAILGQAFLLGGVLAGISMQNNQFSGRLWDWLNFKTLVLALGALAFYAARGAAHFKVQARDNHPETFHLIRTTALLALVLFLVLLLFLGLDTSVSVQARQMPRVWLVAVLAVLVFASWVLVILTSKSKGGSSQSWSIVAFLGLAGIVITATYPYVIPFSVSLTAAAASQDSLVFMLFGVAIFLPVIVVYNLLIRRLFNRRKETSPASRK